MRWDQLLLENIVDIEKLKRYIAEYFKCHASGILVATDLPTDPDCEFDVFLQIGLMYKGYKMRVSFLFAALDPTLDDGIGCAKWLASSFGCCAMVELPDPDYREEALVLYPDGRSIVVCLDEESRNGNPPFYVVAKAPD
jgi:hypothetical protein